MITVRIESYATGRRLKLDAAQTRLFRNELRRAHHHKATKGVFQDVAADCKITVRENGKKKVYELYGRAVLFEPKTNKSWQFYFGLLLLEWVYAP
jgi:hypothetical protein